MTAVAPGTIDRTAARVMAAVVVVAVMIGATPATGQELEPAAYLVSPVRVNVIGVGNTFSVGDLAFDPAGPIEDASARIDTLTVSYGRSLALAGRSANVLVAVPFVAGHLEGRYLGERQAVRRAGLGDPRLRLAINLFGGPAMRLPEFARHRASTLLGASVTVVAPLGQYDPRRLINLGVNRWAVKPEVGLSHVAGRWRFEATGGAWLFTDNTDFLQGRRRSQRPIGSFQMHLHYTVRARLWAAVNGNFYVGGRTSVDGVANFDLQKNSRVGATLAVPLGRRHSLRTALSRGAFTTIGANFTSLSTAYHYTWGAGL